MTTTARSGFASQLQRDTGTDEFLTVAEVLSIGGPSQSRDMIDATSMDSTDQFKEFIGGLVDAGEVTMELNCIAADPEQQALVSGIYGAVGAWRIAWPNFDAASIEIEAVDTVDDELTMTLHGLKTGQPVRFTTDDTLPEALEAGVTYFVGVVDVNTVKVYPTNAAAVAGTDPIDLEDEGTGPHYTARGSVCDMAAGVSGHETTTPHDGKVAVSATVKLTGKPAFTW